MKSLENLLLLSFFALQTVYSQEVPDLISRAKEKEAALDTKAALALYKQAERAEPNNVVVLLGIAKQHAESMADVPDATSKRKRAETAVAYSKKALKLAPENGKAHLSLSISYGRLLDYQGAKKKVQLSRLVKDHADNAIRLEPNSDYAWHMLGRWHRGIVEVDPIMKGLAKIVYGGLPKASNQEAIKAFKKAIELNPNRLSHHIELGMALCDVGKKKEGKAAIERGLSMPVRERADPDTKHRGKAFLSKL